MGYCVVDTETTGLPDFQRPSDWDGQPRIASWAMIFCDEEGLIEGEWSALVRPDGWTMGAEAQAVNGLTMQRLMAEGEPIGQSLLLLLTALQQRRTLVAHNLAFDTKMLRIELHRAGLSVWTHLVHGGVCTMRTLAPVLAIPHLSRPGQLKLPRLSEAYERMCGEPLAGAHDARNDARACWELLLAIKNLKLREAA